MASINKKKLAKGYVWRVQYIDPAGVNRTKSGFKTKDAAQRWADENATHMHRGDWIDPTAGKITITELGTTWAATLTHLKPSTRNNYKEMWDNNVEPHWGGWQAQAVKPSMVQEWVYTMGASPSWVRQCHNILAQVLDVAVQDKAIRENPARGVKLPRKVSTVRVYWTIPQLQLFATECGEREDLALLLGSSGPRWGEAASLRPRDLDPLRSRVQIDRNVVKVGSRLVVGTPKTHERRTIAVARHVMDMLVKRAEGLGPDDLLWEAERGGFLRSPGHNSWFDGALKRAMAKDPTMERVSPHGLRHVAAGLLVNAGANVLAVSRQLGHANPSVTLNTYSELWDDGLDVVASTLDAGFNSVPDATTVSGSVPFPSEGDKSTV